MTEGAWRQPQQDGPTYSTLIRAFSLRYAPAWHATKKGRDTLRPLSLDAQYPCHSKQASCLCWSRLRTVRQHACFGAYRDFMFTFPQNQSLSIGGVCKECVEQLTKHPSTDWDMLWEVRFWPVFRRTSLVLSPASPALLTPDKPREMEPGRLHMLHKRNPSPAWFSQSRSSSCRPKGLCSVVFEALIK